MELQECLPSDKTGSVELPTGFAAGCLEMVHPAQAAYRQVHESNGLDTPPVTETRTPALIKDTLKEAEGMLQEVINRNNANRSSGDMTLKEVEVFDKLAHLYALDKQGTNAEKALRLVLRIYEMAYHPDHPKTVHIIKRLGHVFQQQLRYKEAQMMYERALRTELPSSKFIHPATTGIETFLATVLLKQQRYIEAEAIFRTLVPSLENTLGLEDGQTVQGLRGLGETLVHMHKHIEAQDCLLQAHSRVKSVFGAGNEQTIHIYLMLCFSYEVQGCLIEVEDLVLNLLDHFPTIRPADSGYAAPIFDSLSVKYESTNKQDVAGRLLAAAYDMYVKKFFLGHKGTILVGLRLDRPRRQLERDRQPVEKGSDSSTQPTRNCRS
ncbi:hypothetical protein BJX66DRAFT_338793 [Aspergillus keveii]|uniref:Kinesin light chain n=1 Tax=Aspergillus keveii TaxID=714993 RepID=A0ABR4G3A0_9EURO